MRFTRLCSSALAACAILLPGAVHAQEYPNRAVKMIVPFPPGGTTDVIARLLGPALSKDLGQPLVIDNRGGAGGTIGADLAAKSPADGYTILLYHIGITYAPALYKTLPFDPVKDFAPISLTGSAPSALVVPASLPAANLQEFIALAKARPGALNYGSAGIGTSGHLAAELLGSLAGVKFTHVPYKGGGPAVTATMAGEVQFMVETAGSIVPHVKSGRLRALGTTGAKRTPSMPEAPTISEAGLKDYVYSTWYGLWAPAGTPPAIVSKLSQSVRKVLAQDDTRAAFANAGVDPETSTPERFAEIVRSDVAKWTRIIKEAGITPQ
jgi:tripartite-type tricarboxylate transporter receptor subunit TctC